MLRDHAAAVRGRPYVLGDHTFSGYLIFPTGKAFCKNFVTFYNG